MYGRVGECVSDSASDSEKLWMTTGISLMRKSSSKSFIRLISLVKVSLNGVQDKCLNLFDKLRQILHETGHLEEDLKDYEMEVNIVAANVRDNHCTDDS